MGYYFIAYFVKVEKMAIIPFKLCFCALDNTI